MENIIFYLLIFCIGTICGSFFTLAVYRLPLKQDITHERSYCPNCSHKLTFWDMIPILSYIFLKGKCRYCKEKIRPRYLILETMTGVIFVCFAWALSMQMIDIFHIQKLLYFVVGLLYIMGLIILAGIYLEKRQIQIGVLIYETILVILYMCYLVISKQVAIIPCILYLTALGILWLLYEKEKQKKGVFLVAVCILCIVMAIYTHAVVFYITVIFTLLSVALHGILQSLLKKKQEKQKTIPIIYYLCICNCIALILVNGIAFYEM